MKPILYKVPSFNAQTSHEFTYSWDGGAILEAVITIRDNRNNRVVHTIRSLSGRNMTYPDPDPSNSPLDNGVKYNAILSLKISEGEDAWVSSNPSYFFCTTPPIFTIKGLLAGYDASGQEIDNKINTLNYTGTLEYQQADNDLLHSYKVYLKNKAKVVLYESEEIISYGIDEEFSFPTLTNGDTYYIQAVGYTNNNFKCDTGDVRITVDYKPPYNYATIYLKNNERYGYVDYRTNFVIIQPDDDNKYFTYPEGFIDLRTDKLSYSSGFTINNDFALWLRGKGFTEEELNDYQNTYSTPDDYDHRLLTIHNSTSIIALEVYPFDYGQYRFMLTINDTPDEVDNPLLRVVYSNPIPISEEDVFLICIKNKDGLWGLHVELQDSAEFDTNYWIGNIKPTQSLKANDVWLDTGKVYDPYSDTTDPDEITYMLGREMNTIFDLIDENSIKERIINENIARQNQGLTPYNVMDEFNNRFTAQCSEYDNNNEFPDGTIWVDGR